MNDLIKITYSAGALGGLLLIIFGFQYKKSGAIKNWWLLVLGGAILFLFAVLVLLGVIKLTGTLAD